MSLPKAAAPLLLAASLLAPPTAGLAAPGGPEPLGQPPPTRYRVEQVFRLETTTVQAQPASPGAHPQPVTTAVEGRVRLVLEHLPEPGAAGRGIWRFRQVEVEGPRTEPKENADPRAERPLALGLAWLRQLEGQEFSGAITDLPVLPLGEAPPAWLTAWLRWAQTGSFAGVDSNPVAFPQSGDPATASEAPAASYQVRWLRSEFRQEPCHVQQALWAVPGEAAPGSVTPDLAAEGVEARTHFAAQSLEWIAQDKPELVYAKRSGVRETFWNLEKVKRPELRELIFRLRFAVEVRIERLP